MKRLLTAMTATLVFGCSAVTIQTDGAPIDKSRLSEIKPGVTTRQAVIESFGTPTETTLTDNQEKIVYVYKEKKAPVYLGVIQNQTRATIEVTTLEFTLSEGIVNSYKYKGMAE